MRIRKALTALTLTATAVTLTPAPVHAVDRDVAVNRWTRTHLDACPEEDSRNCLWDAATVGNQIGMSFVDVNGRALYLEARNPRARAHTYKVLMRHLPKCRRGAVVNCRTREGSSRHLTLETGSAVYAATIKGGRVWLVVYPA